MIFRFGGDQSAFDPHGPIARSIAVHGWWLLLVCVAVYIIVMAAFFIALGRRRRDTDDLPETTARLTRNISIAVGLTVLTLIGIATSSVVAGRGCIHRAARAPSPWMSSAISGGGSSNTTT
jgi:heme/copper-type cytochrome/quinol oxidase subunit 2